MIEVSGLTGTRIERIRPGVLAGLSASVMYVYDPVEPYLAISIPMSVAGAKKVIEHLES